MDEAYCFRYKLLDDKRGDTVYWSTGVDNIYRSYSYILIVPYFEKYKKDFVGTDFICEGQKYSDKKFIDINNGKSISVKEEDKWKCVDVTLIPVKNKAFYAPVAIFKNNAGDEFYEYLDKVNELRFITIPKYEEKKYLKQLAIKEREKKEAERREKERKEIEASRNLMIKMYGLKIGTLINNNKVQLGMTMDMCMDAWGRPIHILNITSVGGSYIEWNYGSASLLFKGNILTLISY